jgi:NB-ARC domain
MEEMEENLLPTEAQSRRKIHILHGLGGVGKTQLAIAYARKHQHTYSAIVWVNGNSTDTVLQSLDGFARRAGVGGVPDSTASTAQQTPDMKAEADAVLRWLALKGNRRWLMIFDNVDRDVGSDDEDAQAYDVMSFLSAADHGSVLITTRLSSLGEIGKSTEVTRLRPNQALELLSNRSGLHPSSNGTIGFSSESESTSQLTGLQI